MHNTIMPQFIKAIQQGLKQISFSVILTLVLITLSNCRSTSGASAQWQHLPPPANWPAELPAPSQLPLPADKHFGKSIYKAVYWYELPGFLEDNLTQAWNAWLHNCEAVTTINQQNCQNVRALSIASEEQRRAWLMTNFQPYKIVDVSNNAVGTLTAYYEPILKAQRKPDSNFDIPLYMPPASLRKQKWFSRRDIDNNFRVKQLLRNNVIAYLKDPIMAMKLHIQGSGRLLITEPDGRVTLSRVGYAGTNNHSFRSIAQILYNHGYIANKSWQAVHRWGEYAAKPLVKRMMAQNPRYVFFTEQPLVDGDSDIGPKGAFGVPLTPQRSVAVDPSSIPYGSLLWLQTNGKSDNLSRLVFAQDTGTAIRGAVRADYFVGWENNAESYASTLKQDLRLWIILPRE